MTRTKQLEVLMKFADDYVEASFDQGLHQRTTDDKPESAREKLEKELLRLHARVQELEASQAQRVPLSDAEICDALGIDGSDEWTYTVARAVEAAHGITGELQQ